MSNYPLLDCAASPTISRRSVKPTRSRRTASPPPSAALIDAHTREIEALRPRRKAHERIHGLSGPATLPAHLRRLRKTRSLFFSSPVDGGLEQSRPKRLRSSASLDDVKLEDLLFEQPASTNRRTLQAPPEQVSAIIFSSEVPPKIRGCAEFGLYLRFSVASAPSSPICRLSRPTLFMLMSSTAARALSLHLSPTRQLSGGCAPSSTGAPSPCRLKPDFEPFTLLATQLQNAILTANVFTATYHLRICVAAAEIRKSTIFPGTQATSTSAR